MKARAAKLVRRARAHRVVVKRVEGGKQPVADRRRPPRSKLLAADDRAQPGIAALAPAQRESPGFLGDRFEARVGKDQLGEPGVQIGLGMKEVGHAIRVASQTMKRLEYWMSARDDE